MQRSKEVQGEIRNPSSVISAKKQRKGTIKEAKHSKGTIKMNVEEEAVREKQ